MLETVTKDQGTITWTTGALLDQKIVDRTLPMVQLNLRMNARLNVTVAGTAVQAEAFRNVLANVQLIASDDNGDVAITNASSRALFRHAHFFTGTQPEYDDEDTLATGIAGYDFAVTIPLPLLVPAVEPFNYMTMLAAHRLNGLVIQVLAGAVTDVLAGGTSAFQGRNGAGNPELRVYAEVPTDVDLDSLLTSLYRVTEKSVDVGTVNADLTDARTALNVNSVMQGVIMYARGRTATPVYTARDTIINADRFEAVEQTIANLKWKAGQQNFKTLSALETLPVGYSVIEFLKGGDPRKGRDTRGWADNGIQFNHHIDTAGNQGADVGSDLFVLQRELLIRAA